MADFYEELLKATDNTSDITTEKFGTVTKLENNLCTVKEENADLEHSNVPALNGLSLKLGDKVVIGFVENSIYNPIILGIVGGDGFSLEDYVPYDELNNLPALDDAGSINGVTGYIDHVIDDLIVDFDVEFGLSGMTDELVVNTMVKRKERGA